MHEDLQSAATNLELRCKRCRQILLDYETLQTMRSSSVRGSAPRIGHGSERPAAESHLIVFYDDEEFLVDVVVEFLCTSPTPSDQGLIVARERHAQLLLVALEQRGLDVSEALASGALVMLDPQALIERSTIAGALQAARLIETLDGELRRRCNMGGRVRAYGELAGLLREQGHFEVCTQLEEYWTGVALERGVAVLCGYRGARPGTADVVPAGQLCALHSVALPSEHCSSLGRIESRLQHMFLLERRVQTMEVELEQAVRVEQRLRRDIDMLNARHAAAGELLQDFLLSSQRELAALSAIVSEGPDSANQLLSRVMQHSDAIESVIRLLGHTRGAQERRPS